MFLFGRPIKPHFREFNCFIPLTNSLDRSLTNFCLCCWFIAVKRPDKAAHTKETFESLLPVWEGVNHCDDRKQRQTGHGIGFWNVKAHLQQHTSSNKTIPLNLSNSSKYSNMSLLGSFSIKPPHRVSSFETAILSFWRPGDSYDIEALCHRKAEGKSTFSQWNWLPLW